MRFWIFVGWVKTCKITIFLGLFDWYTAIYTIVWSNLISVRIILCNLFKIFSVFSSGLFFTMTFMNPFSTFKSKMFLMNLLCHSFLFHQPRNHISFFIHEVWKTRLRLIRSSPNWLFNLFNWCFSRSLP